MIWFITVFGIGCLISCVTKLNRTSTDKPYGVDVQINKFEPIHKNDH